MSPRRIRSVLTAWAALVAALLLPSPAHAAAPASPAVSYANPLVNQRADPHIFKHTDGFYYYTATVPEYDRIILRRATTIQGLSAAPETVIWTKHASGEMGAHIWAPEIHFIDGKWYVYFAAGRADDVWRIRMYVLESSAANPLTGGWTEKGRIATPMDSFALDATTFVVNGARYLSWAQKDPAINNNSNLYIARLANPWTITGTPVRLSMPTYGWETVGHKVNEGPAVIQRGGKVFMTYSASATDSNYCLGMLTASASANLLDPAAWTKSPTPVFASNAATGQYGPGHNSFTTSEDGKSDILVYHDRNYKDISGDPLNDPNRRTRVQKVYWNADGTPNFGIPVADGATPQRLSSSNYPSHYLRHWEYRVKLEANVANLADSQFRTVSGLAGNGTVSLESANFPGHYLRARNGEVWVDRNDGSTAFADSASFHRRPGLADAAGVSFEAYRSPGQYLRHYGFLLHVQPVAGTLAGQDATFHQQ
ncbi:MULTISPECIES: family 43 glycosylhydrolase [unclassified Streptomyces]|uniref:family 43 glycosylhydrolase n=1 Tax=unclassified Streptomyces TaxID=2593676 RepID=UPI0036C63CE8